MLLASIRVQVPAKVNVALMVGPLRPDGYHSLATVFMSLSLYDELHLTPAEQITAGLRVPVAGVPEGPDNLAASAARALARRAGFGGGARIVIDKRIPVAGGMAGGSADAAGALVGCNQLWGLGLARPALEEVAAEVGSDVAFAVRGGCAIGSGRGEVLQDVGAAGTYHWVLLSQSEGLSTGQVYRRFDARVGPGRAEPQLDPGLLAALRAGDVPGVASRLANDLQADALDLRPELAQCVSQMAESGLAPLVSGSGPSVVGLARDAEHAEKARAALAQALPGARVLIATGPAGGAEVLPG